MTSSLQVNEPYLTREQFEDYVRHTKSYPIVTVDTEGSINHPHSQTWGLSTSAGGVGDYFAFNHMLGANLPKEWLTEIIEAVRDKTLVMHNAKHDLRALRNLGYNHTSHFYDTMLMSHMTDENRYSQKLDSLSRSFGGDPKRSNETMDAIIKGLGWEYVPVEAIREYGANDAYITEELFYRLLSDFQEQGFDGELWQYEQDFTRLLADMEDTGVLIDQEICELELRRGLKIMREMRKELGFNPASTNELAKFFLEDLGLPPMGYTKKNKPSFDKEAMAKYDEVLTLMEDKRAKQVLIFRGWQKTTSSNYKPYLELLGPDGKLRPNFKQHGTKTGRLSCEHPNLQQIPRESSNDWNGHLKRAFIAEKGRTLYDFDYSQLELRLAAAVSGQQNLINIFNDPTRDIFDEMAKELGMSRGNTKTLNYTVQYGGGVGRLSTVFNVSDIAARAIKSRYHSRYPNLKILSDKAEAAARRDGYVQMWSGRRRHFQYDSECHKAGNAFIQGGAFEVVKRRALALREAGIINDECRLVLQVHDSMVFDIEDGKEDTYLPEIQRVMEDVKPDFGVKFKVGVKKWGSRD